MGKPYKNIIIETSTFGDADTDLVLVLAKLVNLGYSFGGGWGMKDVAIDVLLHDAKFVVGCSDGVIISCSYWQHYVYPCLQPIVINTREELEEWLLQ